MVAIHALFASILLSGVALATPAVNPRDLTIKVGDTPEDPVNCPYTDNGNFGVYQAHTYTSNQIYAAMIAGAKLGAAGYKTVGPQNYPHTYNNGEELPFDCGDELQEFPIMLDNSIYNGDQDMGGQPDRVVYEIKEKKDEFRIKYCGVMRHGPGPFLECEKADN